MFTVLFNYSGFVKGHLYKDVGALPNELTKKYRLTTHFVFLDSIYNKDVNESYDNLHLVRLKNPRKKDLMIRNALFRYFKTLNTPAFKFLVKSRKISHLMMFHISIDKIALFGVYKLKNPKGRIYLKLDINQEQIDRYLNLLRKNNIYSFFLKSMFRIISKQVSLISCETEKCFLAIRESELGKLFGDKLHYITNGVSEKEMLQLSIPVKSLREKENIFLFSGNLGIAVKNVSMFLDALMTVNLKDWKVILIGSTVKKDFDFLEKLSDFSKNFKYYSTKVFVKGYIEDRKELMSYYNRSKCFILTSNYESFGLVLAEAAYFGNYIITTKVGAAEEITHNGEFGSLLNVGDTFQLACEMKKVIDGALDLERISKQVHEYIKIKYTWGSIAKNEAFQTFFKSTAF